MKVSINSSQADYGSEEEAMKNYLEDGELRAHLLGNRGPLRFGPEGRLQQDILSAYRRFGFYVFEDVLQRKELEDINKDFLDILDRLPIARGAAVDRKGRPALGVDCAVSPLSWSKPLGDPLGGTSQAQGRHPVKMFEPKAAADAPKEIVFLVLGALQFSDAVLRLCGHPELLAVAAAVNGEDFVPYNEGLFIKEPGLGASVAWHQDGFTHWNSPEWDEGVHGFNFMAQLYGCTPANAVWVVPGSHKSGKLDIKTVVAKAGSERLPEAVPLICKPGDVAITNRQTLHASFANTSPDWRVTVNFGFHRRGSVLGVEGGFSDERAIYDDDRIRRRSRLIGYAIDARRQRFPEEVPFRYKPHEDSGEAYRWDRAAKLDIKDYNLLDLRI